MASSSSNTNSIIQSSGGSSSSSSSAVTAKNHYDDVFVSFRGIDTRYNFTDHLFAALRRKSIVPFRDDTKLQKGEFIAPELLRAIEASQIYVVVFSKNYASSTWCLRELEYILECVQVSGKCVLPVFYDVDPSEVRKQSGSYAEAFLEHEERFKQDSEKVHRWREALTQAANLSGWDVRDKPQSVEIEKIAEEIMKLLGHKFSSLPKDLVGMHSPIEALEKLLLLDSVDNVQAVGISGMGGIGKTTLATVLYDRISHQFDACCFIDDVSKSYRDHGPMGAQKQILHQTLGEEHLQICNLYHGASLIRSRLRRVRALIILDNVDQVEQLEKLAVNCEWLGAGSRIIIISRDEHILKHFGVDEIYKVPILNETNSRQLFSRKAFKHDNIISKFEELASSILQYAKGLPLAIKVLGSFLFGRDISEWRSALARLRESPSKDIMDVLRLSFDGLEENEKEIFLDIACFFGGHDVNYVKNILQCCGFHPDIGLEVLTEKSLISVSGGSMINMHPLLEELGEKIIQENSTKQPRKWSRLWLSENFYNVMSANMEKNVEAIVLHSGILMAEALSKMSHLRLLIIKYCVNCSESPSCLSNELRYVEWYKCPFMYFPSGFQPNALGQLILVDSIIKQLWEDKKYLPNLKILNLSRSKNLIKMPDFGEIPNLEELNLEGCVKLAKVDSSIGLLQKLVLLNLKDCKNLRSIPNSIFGLSSLKDLNLSGCSKLFQNLMHLKGLDISESALHSQSMSSIFKWITQPFHSSYPTPKAHNELASFLSSSLASFSYLRMLDIGFCSLSQIPDVIGCIHWLERLNLGGNDFATLPSLKELSKLVYLNLEHCKQLKSLPELPSPPTLTEDQDWWPGLYIFNCPKLGEGCIGTTFSWMIQFIRANHDESRLLFNSVGIVIPGSEMPSWFNNQSEGGSISMDLSPIIDDNDNNIIGVVCCAVFSVAPYVPTAMTRHEFEYGMTFLDFRSTHRSFIVGVHKIPVIVDIDLFMVKSNYTWLFYLTRKSFFDTVSLVNETPTTDLHDIKMADLNMRVRSVSPHVEVKNCGYRWVDKHDLEHINLTMMPNNNGDSLGRKRKFLAIEDEAQLEHNHSSD